MELLEPRLLRWDGENSPSLTRRFKNKVPADIETRALRIEVEPAELVIAHALAWTDGAAQFGVTPHGVAFTADGNGWTIAERTYLAGLSPLLDDAADILAYLRGSRGGRFFLREGAFFTADGRRTFMQVQTHSPTRTT